MGRLAKFNPWHKPPGPGGGQFTFGPEGDASAQAATPDESGFEPVEWSLGANLISGYTYGVHGEDVDIAHKIMMTVTRKAMLDVAALDFRPGSPGYGTALHDAFAVEVEALEIKNPLFRSQPMFLLKKDLSWFPFPLPGSSVPDAAYGAKSCPQIIWELKTGSATDTSLGRNILQRARAERNIPCNPVYEYLLVVGR